jgi:hypothetical protein
MEAARAQTETASLRMKVAICSVPLEADSVLMEAAIGLKQRLLV